MVKKNAVAGKQTISFPVIFGYPIGIDFGDAVRGAGIEGSSFFKRYFQRFAEHLAGRGLVEFCFYPCFSYGVKNSQSP